MLEGLVQLCWNDFDTYINKAVKNLRKDDNLCDITLICDDGEIKAHRIILCACSPFFSGVVGKTYNHVHPLLYLRGVSTRILANILDYMYLGVVKMLQEDLTEMLNIASDLKVCGLATSLKKGTYQTENYLDTPLKQVGENKKLIPSKNDKINHLNISKKKKLIQLNEDKIDPPQISYDKKKLDSVGFTDDIVEDDEVKSREEEENFSVCFSQEDDNKRPIIDMDLDLDINKDTILDGILDNIVLRKKSESIGRVFYECRVCKKALKQKGKVRRHAEIYVTAFKHKCLFCGRFYKTRPSLAVHMKGHMKEVKTQQVEDGNISVLH